MRDRMSKQGLLRQQAAAFAAVSKQQAIRTPIPVYADCDVFEFPPARPTAPGRKRYRRGSAPKIKNFGSNPGEVLKAKSECADDKYAKSAVESVRSWWQRRAKEHRVEAFPITVELPQFLGSFLKKAGYKFCGCIFKRGEESAHSVGVPVVGCFGFGDEGRQTSMCKGHRAALKMRCPRYEEVGRSDHRK